MHSLGRGGETSWAESTGEHHVTDRGCCISEPASLLARKTQTLSSVSCCLGLLWHIKQRIMQRNVVQHANAHGHLLDD